MDQKFQQKHQEQQENETHAAHQTSGESTFATSDEMLRHDAEQNPPPPEIAERLNQSIAQEPKKSPSLWEKLGFKK